MKNHKHLSTICLLIAVIVLFAKNNSLKSDVKMLQNSLSNESNRLEAQISSIYANVDKQLKKQASLLSDVTYKTGELDISNKTVDVFVSVLPKELTDDMTVGISFDGKTADAQRDADGKFTAEIPVGLFADYNSHPLLSIKSGDVTRTELLENVHVSNLWVDYLPTITKGDFGCFSATLHDDGLTVNGNLQFDFSLAKNNHSANFTSYCIIAEVDGKEISRKNLTKEINEHLTDSSIDNSITLPFKQTYDLSGGDDFSLYFSAEDSLGYIHKTLAFYWTLPNENGASPEPVAATRYAGEIITDKSGNILFGKNYLQ